ncbi:MAG: hypothetical protein QOG64_2039 [Acidimicrobiaceae bacterium]|nr:hypothetical protein [Acidimicrobiaceae bacterium]
MAMTVDPPRHESSPHDGIVDRRSNRLARALDRLGVARGSRLVVYVRDVHGIDAEVAVAASWKLHLQCTVVEVPADADEATRMARAMARRPPDAILACELGLRALREAKVHTLVVGDGEGVYWWRAVEAKESSEEMPPPPPSARRRASRPGRFEGSSVEGTY